MPEVEFTKSVVGALLQFGAFGALVAWIVMSIIPKMQKENVTARADFRQSLQQMTVDFRDEMRLERQSHHAEAAELRAEIANGFDRIEAVSMDVAMRNGRGKGS